MIANMIVILSKYNYDNKLESADAADQTKFVGFCFFF